MKRLIAAAFFLFIATPSYAANTSVQWGATRTSAPWVVGIYDANNTLQGVFTLPSTGGGPVITAALKLGTTPISGSVSGHCLTNNAGVLGDIACSGNGTVSSIATTAPLAGGTITTTGTLSITGLAGAVLAGSAPAFTTTPTLGASGTLGSLSFGNATSGLVTLVPVTGALGSVTLSLPAATDTLVGKATTDTLTNKTLVAPALGTPASGVATNLTGLPLTTGVTGILPGANGGTGVANTSKTITLGANLVTTGAGVPTLAFGSGSNTITFPTASETLAGLTAVDQTLSGGANVTSFSIGTVSSGTTTIDCGKSPLQFLTGNGAFTFAAPANDGSCDVLITNGASAGAVTFSGFTEGSNTGDALDTTNAHKFLVAVVRINSISHYLVSAYQ